MLSQNRTNRHTRRRVNPHGHPHIINSGSKIHLPSLLCALFNFPWAFAILTPIGALIGDLIAAFFKRRLNLAPGALFPIVDQIDFVVGAIVFALPLGIVSWQLAIATLLITPPIHLFTNFLAYKAKLKKNPW
jgi:CDP-diglyceride synthetase